MLLHSAEGRKSSSISKMFPVMADPNAALKAPCCRLSTSSTNRQFWKKSTKLLKLSKNLALNNSGLHKCSS
jgi:hypothetical protein